MKQDLMRQFEGPHIKARQDKPIGGKDSQEQAKESVTTIFPKT